MSPSKFLICLCSAIAMLPAISVHAAPATVQFSGTLSAATPCELNGGLDFVVDFEDLIIRKINGSTYGRKIVDFGISCDHPTNVKLKVSAGQTTFSNSAIQTSVSALGIALEFNSAPLILGANIDATSSAAAGILRIYATPVLDPAASVSTVTAQAFSATANIVATYE